jgi:hypothetical protein
MNIIKLIQRFFQYSPIREGGYQPRPDAVSLEKPKGGSSFMPAQEKTQDQMESRLNLKTACSRCNHGRDYCWCPLKLR